MNDAEIRKSFHRKKLWKHHQDPETLVIDELGLKHGKCRADIAVMNGSFIGYEIKSEYDSLKRLDEQIQVYSNVFDRVTVVTSYTHLPSVSSKIPIWWGIIVAKIGPKGVINFKNIRGHKKNPRVDHYSVAQLLWHEEAKSLLLDQGISFSSSKVTRDLLYRKLLEVFDSNQLREAVKRCLKNRKNWRRPLQPSPDDGLYQPTSM
jgi:hypothetical protein